MIGWFYEQKNLKTWYGFRLLAVDGSKLRLPNEPELINTFHVHKSRKGQPVRAMAKASVCYDVLNQQVLDAQLGASDAGERDMAWQHIQSESIQGHSNLWLMDRGYPSFWLYHALISLQQSFCIRMKENELLVKQFLASGKKQSTITITPNAYALKQCHKRGLASHPLTLRIIRIKHANSTWVLLTNLMDEQRFPAEQFRELYHYRWQVEEYYKRLKRRANVEAFSGKTAHSIYQDFHAKILSLNLIALTTYQENPERAINFNLALKAVKTAIVPLLSGCLGHLKRLLENIRNRREKIRKGRSFPRKNHKFFAKPLGYSYR